MQNRLEYTASNLMGSIQNNANSMSTIRDTDFAAEAAALAKNQILGQSGTAMPALYVVTSPPTQISGKVAQTSSTAQRRGQRFSSCGVEPFIFLVCQGTLWRMH